MTDTPDFIRKKQFEIIYQKSDEEKLKMSVKMIENSLYIAYGFIKSLYPDFSHRQIITKRFQVTYKNNFPKEILDKILQHLLLLPEN